VIVYIDENFPRQLAAGLHLLEQPVNSGLEVRAIAETFGRGVKDEEWIPKVGAEEAVVITQDLNIHRSRSQKKLYRENRLGVFFFAPPSRSGYSYWEMVEQVVKRWGELRILCNRRRPFAFRCTNRSSRFEPMP
jgi:hypothetical protein